MTIAQRVAISHSGRAAPWSAIRKLVFRFVFTYMLLQAAPWTWWDTIPGFGYLSQGWAMLMGPLVREANARLFHVRDTLVMPNGSGDTSYAWAEVCTFLVIAALVTLVWSVLDRRRRGYARLDYWFRNVLRYYLALAALTYGLIKVFPLQMGFPTLSNLATPLGDLLPMRLSWLFIGYSTPYQMFSGAVEVVAGLLLLNRRTMTLGLLVAGGAFANVVMLNLAYDVPVKLYSSHLLLATVILLMYDAQRLFSLFVLNSAVGSNTLWEPAYRTPRQQWASRGATAVFIVLFLLLPLGSNYARYQSVRHPVRARPFATGVYNVTQYVLNGDTLPALSTDSLRWQNVIIDGSQTGSAATNDTLFTQRYGRGYFRYRTDTIAGTIAVWKTSAALDSTFLFNARYEQPDSNTIRFWTTGRSDSLYVRMVRSPRHFQLAERQFHWLSEYNR